MSENLLMSFVRIDDIDIYYELNGDKGKDVILLHGWGQNTIMMDFITIPLVVGIICAGIYGLFELFVRKKERLAIIEKISNNLDASAFEGKLGLPNYMSRFSFSALKVGCLLAGIGLGLMVGFFINLGMRNMYYQEHQFTEMAFGASVLLFGGIGLIVAFIIELKLNKDKKA